MFNGSWASCNEFRHLHVRYSIHLKIVKELCIDHWLQVLQVLDLVYEACDTAVTRQDRPKVVIFL